MSGSGISIHASAREATIDFFQMFRVIDISIHASAREATDAAADSLILGNISIHASAREATARRLDSSRILTNFNPRLREGGDG